MPRIPLPEISSVQPAVVPGARPADQTARFRGQAALAQGIGEVGDAMAQFAIRSQQLQNEGALAKGKLAMAQAQADIDRELAAEADFEKWEQIADRHIQRAQESLAGLDQKGALAPIVRRQLEQDFAAFGQNMRLRVRNQADRARNEDADRALAELAKLAYSRGDYEEGDTITAQRRDRGSITQNDATLQMTVGRQFAEREQAKAAILEDPLAAQELLADDKTYPNLTKSDRLALLRTARIESQRLRAERVQGFAERIYSGELVPEAELDAAVQAREILPTQKRWLMQQQTSVSPNPLLYQRAAELGREVNALDLNQPDGEEQYWRLWGEAALMPTQIREELQRQLRGARAGDPATGKIRIGNEYIDGMLRGGFYGDITLEDGEPLNPTQYERAYRMQARLKQALIDFIAANPTASSDEVLAHLQAVDQQARTNSTVLFNRATGRASSR